MIRRQLGALSGAYGLPQAHASNLSRVFDLLAGEALDQTPYPPYGGLSQISRNGLPFQWSFCLDNGAPTVRFVCEAGAPGAPAPERHAVSLQKLRDACALLDIPHPQWLFADILPRILPPSGAWPEHWRGALWFAAGAGPRGIALKAYLNLNREAPVERWRRIGWALKALGRDAALGQLCALSGRVSEESWPHGLAVDILPDGRPGRLKAYFGSGPVTRAWLARWYQAAGAETHYPAMEQLLDLFPHPDGAHYVERAFFVGLEFADDGGVSLKTDVTLSRWADSDAQVAARTFSLLGSLGLDSRPYRDGLEAIGGWPPDGGACAVHQLVGFGFEPDGAHHVNVYCAPALPDAPP